MFYTTQSEVYTVLFSVYSGTNMKFLNVSYCYSARRNYNRAQQDQKITPDQYLEGQFVFYITKQGNKGECYDDAHKR